MKDTIAEEVDFIGQEPNRELIEWVHSSGKGSLVAEGLYSSAKACAMASAMERGIHMVLLDNKEDAAYCASDLSSLLDGDTVFFFPSSVNLSLKNRHKDSSFQVQRTAAIGAITSYNKEKRGKGLYLSVILSPSRKNL